MINHAMTLSHDARTHLVQQLRKQGIIQSEHVAQAFLAIPRETYVTTFFEQEAGFEWKVRTPQTTSLQLWIEAIYRDIPLVTSVTAQHRVISTSSSPGVMALMIEALDIRPGMRILEIGTGSGYNAALLAHLVGPSGFVATIELDDALAQSAHDKLAQTTSIVSVHAGDGYAGVPQHAPYDRILVTASSPSIPPSWHQQLAPHGRLVMDLQGSMRKSSFLLLEKMEDGSAHGKFLPTPIYFMPMRTAIPKGSSQPIRTLLQQKVTQHVLLPQDQFTTILLECNHFHWFLQWAWPGVTLSKAQTKPQDGSAGVPFLTWIDPQGETILQLYQRANSWSGYERGREGLWQQILEYDNQWKTIDHPPPTDFAVDWDQQRQCFILHSMHHSFQCNISSLYPSP